MEPGKEAPDPAGEGDPESCSSSSSSSFQARLWRNLQMGSRSKSRGGISERRSAETSPSLPRAREQPGPSKWAGFRRRKPVLDRVFSSSQPNLCCNSAETLEGPEAGSALRRLREHILHPPRSKGNTPPSSASSSVASSPRLPREKRGADGAPKAEEKEEKEGKGHQHPQQQPLSHQKSSSLPGTACLEQLLQESPTKGKGKGKNTGGASSSPKASPRTAPRSPQDSGVKICNYTKVCSTTESKSLGVVWLLRKQGRGEADRSSLVDFGLVTLQNECSLTPP
nr:PREDICTED: multiple C2 and transmembrane domain-containing protein 1-like [Anolis carolinensis]|eukprot:XP_008101288.1 PREDICTED: multiple C2 and transmembrane domain-containing protein 1-like [Anolis carolinensis]